MLVPALLYGLVDVVADLLGINVGATVSGGVLGVGRRAGVVRTERANPALRYVERKGKGPSEAAATVLAPTVATRTAATNYHFPSVAALGGSKGPVKTQAATGVEPWVPVAANVRDGQVAALYSGLAKCEGGKAVLAAAARARAGNV